MAACSDGPKSIYAIGPETANGCLVKGSTEDKKIKKIEGIYEPVLDHQGYTLWMVGEIFTFPLTILIMDVPNDTSLNEPALKLVALYPVLRNSPEVSQLTKADRILKGCRLEPVNGLFANLCKWVHEKIHWIAMLGRI